MSSNAQNAASRSDATLVIRDAWCGVPKEECDDAEVDDGGFTEVNVIDRSSPPCRETPPAADLPPRPAPSVGALHAMSLEELRAEATRLRHAGRGNSAGSGRVLGGIDALASVLPHGTGGGGVALDPTVTGEKRRAAAAVRALSDAERSARMDDRRAGEERAMVLRLCEHLADAPPTSSVFDALHPPAATTPSPSSSEASRSSRFTNGHATEWMSAETRVEMEEALASVLRQYGGGS